MKVLFVICVAFSGLLALAAAAEESPNARQLRGDGGRGKGKGRGRGKGQDSASSDDDYCEDPAGVVLALLECFFQEDVECVNAGYVPDFEKYHNEILSDEALEFTEEFWNGAFAILDLSFEIRFANNAGPNLASVRYIETVAFTDGANLDRDASTDYPFGYTRLQHEHALVTVDNDCKLVKWDQYGDDKEQADVTDASNALICILGDGDSCVPNRV